MLSPHLERVHDDHGSEDFLLHDLHVGSHIGDDCGLVKVACQPRRALASSANGGAGIASALDHAVDPIQVVLGDDRAHLRLVAHGVSKPDRRHFARQLVHKLVDDRFVRDDAGARDAGLSARDEACEGRAVHDLVDVHVLEHDERRLAAQLHRRRREVPAGGRGDPPARGRAAREVDFLDAWVRRQRLAGLGAEPGDAVEHAGGQPGVESELGKLEDRERRELRGLDDDRVARGERRRDLLDSDEQRVVPRRDLWQAASAMARGWRGRAGLTSPTVPSGTRCT